MENLNNHFEESREISERIKNEFQKINRDAKQRLQEINRRLDMANNSLKETPNEEAIVSSVKDTIQTSNVEKDIQTFMKKLDVSAINEETIAEIDAEYQDQMEQKMSDEEVSRFVDEVHNDSKEMNAQQEPKETKEIVSNVMLNENIIQLCKEKSVKPGVKVKNKQKTRKMNENNVKKNILKFVGACAVLSGLLTVGATYADDIYANHLRREALETYTETVYEPNTSKEWIHSDKGNRQINVHDWKNLIEQTHKTYENPVVGFYMLYTKLDKESKNNYMNTIMAEFNLYYGTDYKDVDDVLDKNNFKNFKDLSKYVSFEIYRMGAEEEVINVYDEIQDSPTRG